MNAQVQHHRSVASDPIPRSSARSATAARADAQSSPPLAEDRPSSTPRRVDPLWMITAAGALLFVFLMAAVSFS